MKASVVREIYRKELRSLFRDRHILLYTVALPAFLYPIIFLGAFQIISYLRGIEDRQLLSVAVEGDAEEDLREFLGSRRIELELEGREAGVRLLKKLAGGARRGDPRDRLALGSEPSVDAIVVARRSGRFSGLSAPGVDVELYYASARDASRVARERLEALLEEWRRERLLASAREIGAGESFLETLVVETNSLSTPTEVANYVAGLIMPLLMILMTAIGAFYPALECTVGEKEKGTLETSLVAPVRRSALVLGKYLAVTTAALVSFGLNFGSMSATTLHLQAQLPIEGFRVSPWALLVIALAAIFLAAFLSSLMMLLAFLARTFKEGQTYVAPIYLMSMLPILVTTNPEVELTPSLAMVPFINSALLFREALEGQLAIVPVSLGLASSGACVILALWAASRVLGREAVASGQEVSLSRALRPIFRRAAREEVSA